MSDEGALLRAIIESPGDDGLRLIFADWLEERGDPRFFLIESLRFARPIRFRLQEHCWWPESGQDVSNDDIVHATMLLHDAGLGWCDLATVRRGFVASVACTLIDWCGADCRRCGTPEWRRNHPGVTPGSWSTDCPRCHGIGRVGGHGPALVWAAPLTEVRLTDREPYHNESGEWVWLSDELHAQERATMPAAVFDLLAGGDLSPLGTARYYATEADALAAPSAACLAWAKAQPLPPPPVNFRAGHCQSALSPVKFADST